MSSNRAPSIGVLIHGTAPPRDLPVLARQIETLGFADLWVSEDYFLLSGFASAGIALQATENIRVGLGAISSVARHPAVAAMEAATIAGAFPGRFTLAIGHGVPAWTQQMGLHPKSPLTAMRECVTGIRRLLAGETLSVEGEYFTFRDVRLAHTAPNLKILTAVIGSKSIDLTGEIADGLVISALAGPNYIRSARDRLALAYQRTSRPGNAELPVFALTCIDKDDGHARATIRGALAGYLAALGPTAMSGSYGINEALTDMIARGGADVIAREMPDEWLDWFVVAGNPERCAKQIAAMVDAGATAVVLAVVGPPETFDMQLELAAAELLPAATRRGG